jgi:anti-anti-sigma regulatory factor/HAMP domain-containing protein
MMSIVRPFTSSIQRRIMSSFAIIIVFVLAMAIIGYYQLDRVRSTSEQVIPNSLQMKLLEDFALSISSLDANLERFFVIRNTKFRKAILQDIETMADTLEDIKENANKEMKPGLEKLDETTITLGKEISVLLDMEITAETSRETNEKIIEVYAQIDNIKQLHRELSAETLGQLQNAAKEQGSSASNVIVQFLILSASVALLVVIASLVVTRSIAAPLKDLAEIATQVAAGDMERTVEIEREDEIGALALAFNSMITNLREMLQREQEQRQHLQQAQDEVEERFQTIQSQQQAIQELSTPVIPIMEAPDGSGSIIVLPLIGSIDSMRARDITRSLLAGISQHRAKVVILDVTGVGIMDTGIVNHLNKTIQAAQLKGARTIVTGISDAVAEAIVDLGIDWSKVTTLSNLQTGLITALDSLGFRLTQ